MKARNEYFEVGQRYLGLVNNEVFVVSAIQLPGTYQTASGGLYTVASTRILLKSERTGQVHKCGYEAAKRLLFKRLESQSLDGEKGEEGASVAYLTLSKQDRFRYVSELSEADRSNLLGAVRESLRISGTSDLESAIEGAQASKIVDLEDTIHIHYVDKSCDLDAVQPIPGASFQDALSSRIQAAEGKKQVDPSLFPKHDDPPER